MVYPWISGSGDQQAGCRSGQWRGDKHCTHNQPYFDKIAQTVAQTVMSKDYVKERAVILRNFSLTAAASIPNSTLQLAYIDARHDRAGVTEDLRAWWPKVCPGGFMAGHDFERSVAVAVGSFLQTMPHNLTLIVTSEHPASWFVAKPPSRC